MFNQHFRIFTTGLSMPSTTKVNFVGMLCALFVTISEMFSPSALASTLINYEPESAQANLPYSSGGEINHEAIADYQWENGPAWKAASVDQETVRNDDIPTIRVLFLYIDAVKSRYAVNEIDKQIQALVLQTNKAYQSTGIDASVEAAYIGEWPFGNDEEIAAQSAKDIFLGLQRWVDTELWTEEGLMYQYGADAVFVVDYRDAADKYCGWASIDDKAGLSNYNQSNSFGIIRLGVGCGSSAIILAHELGHLLGSAHGENDTLTASESMGYGVVCNGQATIMHTNFPKHLFFSNPMLSSNGEVCGNPDSANNAKLFNENAILLADKHLYQSPSTEVSLAMSSNMDKSVQPLTLESDLKNAVNVTLYRTGVTEISSSIEWHYSTENLANPKFEIGGFVNFEPGQTSKTIEVPVPTLLNENSPYFSIYLRNPKNTNMGKKKLTITKSNEDTSNNLVVNFSAISDGLNLQLSDTSLVPNTAEITQTRWQIVNAKQVSYFGEGSELTLNLAEPGIYEVTLTLETIDGTQKSQSTAIRVGAISSASHERHVFAVDDTQANSSDTNSSGGGGSFSWALIGLVILISSRTRLIR